MTNKVQFIPLSRVAGKITAIMSRSYNDHCYLAVAGTGYEDDTQLWFSIYALTEDYKIKALVSRENIEMP